MKKKGWIIAIIILGIFVVIFSYYVSMNKVLEKSTPNNNACEVLAQLGTCRKDLDANGIPDVDDRYGAGFADHCCNQGYTNCCS